MRVCDECRHFNATGADSDGKSWGWCELTTPTYDGQKLAVVRQYREATAPCTAALKVREDFGCVQWQEAL